MTVENIIDSILKAAAEGKKSIPIKSYLNYSSRQELMRRGYEVVEESSFCVQYEGIYYTIKWK